MKASFRWASRVHSSLRRFYLTCTRYLVQPIVKHMRIEPFSTAGAGVSGHRFVFFPSHVKLPNKIFNPERYRVNGYFWTTHL